MVVAFNKVDRLNLTDETQAAELAALVAEFPNSVVISVLRGWGIAELAAAVDRTLKHHMVAVDVLIPYTRGDLVALVHEHGYVEHEEHTAEGTHLVGRLPLELAGRYAAFWAKIQVQSP